MHAYLTNLKDPDATLYSKKPKTIWVKNKSSSLLQINTEVIEQRLRFQWLEDIIISDLNIKQLPADIAAKLQESKSFCSSSLSSLSILPFLSSVKHYLENIHTYINKLALIDMDDLGFGTIAKEDFKNTNDNILTFYAGEINLIPCSPSYDYYTLIGDFPCVIDSQSSGNISRFMPHLPHQHELDSLGLSDKDRSIIATVNVTKKAIKLGFKEIILFYVEQDILAEEIIGFSYGRSFWTLKDYSFWLLQKNGNKFAKVKYNKDGDLTYTND